jgi:hypothetical protein
MMKAPSRWPSITTRRLMVPVAVAAPAVPLHRSPSIQPGLDALSLVLSDQHYSAHRVGQIVAFTAAQGTPSGSPYLMAVRAVAIGLVGFVRLARPCASIRRWTMRAWPTPRSEVHPRGEVQSDRQEPQRSTYLFNRRSSQADGTPMISAWSMNWRRIIR